MELVRLFFPALLRTDMALFPTWDCVDLFKLLRQPMKLLRNIKLVWLPTTVRV